MEFKTYTVLTLLMCSSTAFAWQPLTYPVRSQSPYQRSIDTATCYAEANKTGVSITRESQIPPRKAPPSKATSTGAPARPPLPPSTFSATPPPAGMPGATPEPGASAPMATADIAGTPGAAAAAGVAGTTGVAGTARSAGSAGSAGSAENAAAPGGASSAKSAHAAKTASDATATAAAGQPDGNASGAAADSSQANAASNVKLPPLPEPEPPMARYWAAYSSCMQARGYVVAQ